MHIKLNRFKINLVFLYQYHDNNVSLLKRILHLGHTDKTARLEFRCTRLLIFSNFGFSSSFFRTTVHLGRLSGNYKSPRGTIGKCSNLVSALKRIIRLLTDTATSKQQQNAQTLKQYDYLNSRNNLYRDI